MLDRELIVDRDPEFALGRDLFKYTKHPYNKAWYCYISRRHDKYEGCLSKFIDSKVRPKTEVIIWSDSPSISTAVCIPCYYRYIHPNKSIEEAMKHMDFSQPITNFIQYKFEEKANASHYVFALSSKNQFKTVE
jgi:hypothetical protein